MHKKTQWTVELVSSSRSHIMWHLKLPSSIKCIIYMHLIISQNLHEAWAHVQQPNAEILINDRYKVLLFFMREWRPNMDVAAAKVAHLGTSYRLVYPHIELNCLERHHVLGQIFGSLVVKRWVNQVVLGVVCLLYRLSSRRSSWRTMSGYTSHSVFSWTELKLLTAVSCFPPGTLSNVNCIITQAYTIKTYRWGSTCCSGRGLTRWPLMILDNIPRYFWSEYLPSRSISITVFFCISFFLFSVICLSTVLV